MTPSLWARTRVARRSALMALLLALTALGAWTEAQRDEAYRIGMGIGSFTPEDAREGTLQADGTRRYATRAVAEIDNPYSDAALAGVRDGDVLLRVGPVALGDSTTNAERDEAADARRGPLGSEVEIVVRRDGQPVTLAATRGGRARELAASVGLSYRALVMASGWLRFGAILFMCAAGLFLFVRSRAAGYLGELGLGVVGLGTLLMFLELGRALPKWVFVVLLLLGVPLALPLLVRTAVRFPDGAAGARWVRLAPLVPVVATAGIFFVLIVVPFVPGAQDASGAWVRALMAVGVGGGSLVAAAAALGWRYRRAEDAEVRQQMKWVLVPLTALVVTFVWSEGVAPLVPALEAQASVGTFVLARLVDGLQSLAFAVLPLAIVAGALRFRPWDADLWIGRSVAVGAATLGLAAIFAGGSEALRVGLKASMGEGADALAAALAGVISVIVFNPTREWVQARAERGLRRTREILGERLPLVLSGRQVVAAAPEIARVALAGVREALQPDRAAVLLRRPDGWAVVGAEGVAPVEAARWAGASAAEPDGSLPDAACQTWDDPLFVLRVPLRSVEGEPVGLLALGTHGEGRGYSTEERRALDRVARPLAEALLVAERREAARDAEYTRLARLVERVGSGDGRAGAGEPAVGG